MITIIVAILVGAACLGIGYLLGKKKKVIEQANIAIGALKEKAKDTIDKV